MKKLLLLLTPFLSLHASTLDLGLGGEGSLPLKTSLGLSKRFQNMWTGAFVRYYSLNESMIEDSPLKEEKSALYGGVFIAYIFDDNVTRSIKNWLE